MQSSLTTLLSQALVAFTIEFDNEAEHRMPHRTALLGASGGGSYHPWLISMAMWFNCLRWLNDGPSTVGELLQRARTPTNLDGMRRWGYVSLTPPAGSPDSARPNARWQIALRPAGRMAYEILHPLARIVEERWRDRFGGLEIDALRNALAAVACHLDPGLPDCIPILGYGLVCTPPPPKLPPVETVDLGEKALPALLSRVLVALAFDFERHSPLSLAICANLLRVLGSEPMRVRDLPQRTGVSKESLQMAIGILRKKKLVDIGKEGAGPVVRLTTQGLDAQSATGGGLARLEQSWARKYPLNGLRAALEPIVGDGTRTGSLLFMGLEPYADGWRAVARPAHTLPHFPMVLHRGGYPDGS